jgi:protein-tyrosine phosphatase
MTETLRELSGGWNFRDVADGTTGLRPGRLFRSGELSRLDDDGRATLRELGITDVADLRAAREVARRGPGLVPDGVDIHLLPMPDLGDQDPDDEPDGEPPHEAAFRKLFEGEGGEANDSSETPAEAAGRYMVDEYRQFPTRNGTQQALNRVVTLLGEGRTVLTHCFAGKDRTGFVIATVLEMVGLDRDAIVADYLRSNNSVSVLRDRITESLSQRTDIEVTPEIVKFTEARLSDEVLGVRPEYLAASWQTIDEAYGSLDAYLRDAGIGATHIDQLRGALLS